jgi:hypothetical protein
MYGFASDGLDSINNCVPLVIRSIDASGFRTPPAARCMLPLTLFLHSSAYPYPYASEAEVTSSSTQFLQPKLPEVNKAPPFTLLASPHAPSATRL